MAPNEVKVVVVVAVFGRPVVVRAKDDPNEGLLTLVVAIHDGAEAL